MRGRLRNFACGVTAAVLALAAGTAQRLEVLTDLPAGPVFISVPLIGLLPGDDALAGILAHELAHVVLRHAVLQVTEGEPFQVGAISGRQLGLAAAGPVTGVLERGAAFSIATYFLRFGAAHGQQAESLGLRMMKAEGYAPAGFMEFVAAMRLEGAAHGGLEWLGRHPKVRVAPDTGPVRVSAGLTAAQAQLRGVSRPVKSRGPTFRMSRIAGRNALSTTWSHVCGVTGEFETVMLTALHLDEASLLYFLATAPQADAGTYRRVFEQTVSSLQILE